MQQKQGTVDRREFCRIGSMGVLAAALASPLEAFAAPAKIRVALVGTGIRGSTTWGTNLLRDAGELVEIVGLCDVNPDRVKVAQRWMGGAIPTFTDFDEMIRATKPARVIVTTVDATHADYVCRAMELGLDPISEKPLCTHAEQAQRIVDVQKRTGRTLDVTFNARHEASAMKVKELLLAGEIGDLYSVGYEEFLDLDHGASYFRRWHGLKQASGTLLCHKASHHFDQLNWWIDAEPLQVAAHGRLNKYGVNGPFRHANCRLCPHKQRCDLHWDITTSKQLVEAVRGLRGPGRLLPGRLSLQAGDQHPRHVQRPGHVRQPRVGHLQPQRHRALRRPVDRVQRIEGPDRRPQLQQPALEGAARE